MVSRTVLHADQVCMDMKDSDQPLHLKKRMARIFACGRFSSNTESNVRVVRYGEMRAVLILLYSVIWC